MLRMKDWSFSRWKRQVGLADQKVLALVLVEHEADARVRHELTDRLDQVGELLLHCVDHEIHAVGGVDHEDDVEADLFEQPDEIAETAAEPPADAASETAARADARPERHSAPGGRHAAHRRSHRQRIDLRG